MMLNITNRPCEAGDCSENNLMKKPGSEGQPLINLNHVSETEDAASEIMKLANHYDQQLQRWRKVVAFIFVGSALAIVYTTHSILTRQLENSTKASV